METRAAAASFLDYCRLRSLGPNTLEFYRWGLEHLMRHLEELPTHHRQLVKPLTTPSLAQESRRDLERVLRRFFRWASAEYGVPNPMLGMEPIPRRRTLPRILSDEETRAVWEACNSERDRALVAVVMDTGVRLGELATMEKRHLAGGVLRVVGKVGHRQVPLTPEVMDMLHGIGTKRWVWCGPKGPLTRSGIQLAFGRMFRRAGLTGPKIAGPHCLRHTFGTRYVAKGGSVTALQAIMGHQSIETTMIYVSLAGEIVSKDHAKHSPAKELMMYNGGTVDFS